MTKPIPTLLLLMFVLTLPLALQARKKAKPVPVAEEPVEIPEVCHVEYLTTEMCSQDIARLDTTAWAYKGSMPCVIDCYTTWCGPCKRLAPIMEELAEQYCGRVCFYKTDIERDRLLGRVFGAASIPTIVYVPVDGQPIVTKGLMPKEQYVQIIESVLLHQGAAAETQPNQE